MKGNAVDLISLDFRKAFVMVPPGKLLSGRVQRLGVEFYDGKGSDYSGNDNRQC